MGTRGKSTLVAWLHEALVARGLDTYSKVTGEQPYSLYNGEVHPIRRTPPTMLYETDREIRRFDPTDAIVIENHGIREYTTRLVNDSYVDPTLVVLTNVRRDHLDTLGRDSFELTRALARAVPPGTPVVTAERNDVLAEYLRKELDRRDAPLTRVEPESVGPADELLALLEAALEASDVDPLTPPERADFHGQLEIDWIDLPGGRVHDASNVNDVESTEFVRQALQNGDDEVFQPLVYFRGDRPGRTDEFLDYLGWLAGAGHIEQVRCLGAHQGIVTRRLDLPVICHDEATERPGAVLDAALSDGWPVVLMGNTVPEFMVEMAAEIERRSGAGAALEPPVVQAVAPGDD